MCINQSTHIFTPKTHLALPVTVLDPLYLVPEGLLPLQLKGVLHLSCWAGRFRRCQLLQSMSDDRTQTHIYTYDARTRIRTSCSTPDMEMSRP